MACRRLQKKKEKSDAKKRNRREDRCGGFSHLKGKAVTVGRQSEGPLIIRFDDPILIVVW